MIVGQHQADDITGFGIINDARNPDLLMERPKSVEILVLLLSREISHRHGCMLYEERSPETQLQS